MPNLTTKITGSNNYFSLISLNINGLNSPIKRHRLTNWLHKQDPTFCCLQETHLREKDRHYLRMKGWKTIFQANCMRKQAGVVLGLKACFPKTCLASLGEDASNSANT
jgi:exonuclease III